MRSRHTIVRTVYPIVELDLFCPRSFSLSFSFSVIILRPNALSGSSRMNDEVNFNLG